MADPSPDNLSWSTISRAAAGDRTARSMFGRTYLPVVRSFLEARWRGTTLAREVEDAVQDVFVECLRDNGVLARAEPGRGDVRGLLFGVSRNVAARFEERARRNARRDRTAGSAIDEIPAREPSLSRLFDREWARTMMRLAGDRMRTAASDAGESARRRVELLELRFGSGMPIRDIARAWGVDADAVHRDYARARDEFRACLHRVLAEHTVRDEVDLDAEVRRLLHLIE